MVIHIDCITTLTDVPTYVVISHSRNLLLGETYEYNYQLLFPVDTNCIIIDDVTAVTQHIVVRTQERVDDRDSYIHTSCDSGTFTLENYIR